MRVGNSTQWTNSLMMWIDHKIRSCRGQLYATCRT